MEHAFAMCKMQNVHSDARGRASLGCGIYSCCTYGLIVAILQASAGVGYANVKMMQYDVKHYGQHGRFMDITEMVK